MENNNQKECCNYLTNVLKNFKQEDTEKFLVSNESKNFWNKSFKNELQVDWNKFKTEFEKVLIEMKLEKDDIFDAFLFLKYRLVNGGKVNVFNFGELFHAENSFKEVIENQKFEADLKKSKEKGDDENKIITAFKSYFGIGVSKDEHKGKNEFLVEYKLETSKLAEAFVLIKGWNDEFKIDYDTALEILSGIYYQDKNFLNTETSYAVYLLAKMFENGQGTDKNMKKANLLLEMAAINGNVIAQYEMGENIKEKDFNKAKEYFEKSARGTYSIAYYQLAKFYEAGNGEEFPKDLDTAIWLFERASQLGVTDASYYIASLYLVGSEGVEKNIPKAITLFNNASSKGHHQSTEKLKQINEEGIKITDHLETGVKDCILNGKCTRVSTGKSYEEQCFYDCLTCGIKGNKGVCETCKDVCHKGHEVVNMKFGGFFCDCVDNFKDCIYKPEPEIEDTSGKHFENLFGETIVSRDGESKPTQETLNNLVVGVYFSAHWCGPCRKFTPKLVNLYEELNKDGKKFEIVFISSDQSAEKMSEYMNEMKMPWLSVPFDSPKVKDLKKKFKVNGIPHISILNNKAKIICEDAYDDVTLGFKAFDEKYFGQK